LMSDKDAIACDFPAPIAPPKTILYNCMSVTLPH
jgi:hypothetical protein